MSTTAKTHGMDGELVKPDWPSLTLNELRALFEQFPAFDGRLEIMTESPRPLSAAGVVRTTRGDVFVKRHHRSVRDRVGLREEHAFMEHLVKAGASVPRVLPAASGETAIEIGEWTYEVHEIPSGIDLYEDAISWTPFRYAAHAFSAGQALARLHLAAEGYDAPLRKPQPLVASFTIFAAQDAPSAPEHYLDQRPTLSAHPAVRSCCRQALELLQPFHARLRPLLPALPALWTHNDLHCSNLQWSDASEHAHATAIFDFGLEDTPVRTMGMYDSSTHESSPFHPRRSRSVGTAPHNGSEPSSVLSSNPAASRHFLLRYKLRNSFRLSELAASLRMMSSARAFQKVRYLHMPQEHSSSA